MFKKIAELYKNLFSKIIAFPFDLQSFNNKTKKLLLIFFTWPITVPLAILAAILVTPFFLIKEAFSFFSSLNVFTKTPMQNSQTEKPIEKAIMPFTHSPFQALLQKQTIAMTPVELEGPRHTGIYFANKGLFNLILGNLVKYSPRNWPIYKYHWFLDCDTSDRQIQIIKESNHCFKVNLEHDFINILPIQVSCPKKGDETFYIVNTTDKETFSRILEKLSQTGAWGNGKSRDDLNKGLEEAKALVISARAYKQRPTPDELKLLAEPMKQKKRVRFSMDAVETAPSPTFTSNT